MADVAPALQQLAQAIPQLSAIPPCAQPAYLVIASAGCGPDLECICSNDSFFITIQGLLATGACSSMEVMQVRLHLTENLLDAISSTRSICVEAVPWLEDNRGPEIVGAVTTLTILATIAVVLRFLGRNISGAPCGVDDWLMLFALVWEYGLSISQYLAVHYGLGRHIIMLDLYQVTQFSKLFFAVTCIFPVGCAALKLSVLFFYHRIFPIRKFTIWSIIIGIVVIGWFIAFIVSQFLTCRPLNYYWDKSIPGGKYTITNPAIWLNVEIAIGILSGSLPLMRPLVSRAFPSRVRSYFSRSSRNDGSQRLDDPSNKNSASSGSKGQGRPSQIYVGGIQSHKAWYNNAVVTSGGDGSGVDGSTEEIIPLGKIGVRSDVEWEQEGVSDKASDGK
ncbi:MAG: hypothetical protein Q9171_002989, partial [Xanthocarpia ochracea]